MAFIHSLLNLSVTFFIVKNVQNNFPQKKAKQQSKTPQIFSLVVYDI